jgi:hypothetical protein
MKDETVYIIVGLGVFIWLYEAQLTAQKTAGAVTVAQTPAGQVSTILGAIGKLLGGSSTKSSGGGSGGGSGMPSLPSNSNNGSQGSAGTGVGQGPATSTSSPY